MRIAEYFQDVHGRNNHQANSEEEIGLWTRLEAAGELKQEIFTTLVVERAIKSSNYIKGLGLDGFVGTILRPVDPSHRLSQKIATQILSFLNNPASIPR